MLIKFTDFVTWPEKAFENTPGTFVIGILGNREIYEQLSQLSGSSVQGRTLSVINLRDWDPATPVHLVYIDRSRLPELDKIVARGDPPPVLTVSDSEAFLRAGGMVSFLPMEQGRIGFAVNRDVQVLSGISFKSALLRLAEIRRYGGGAE